MKILIIISTLLLTISAQANFNAELAELVESRLGYIEGVYAAENGFDNIHVDRGSVRCLAEASYGLEGVLVGTCLATGDLDHPNSSSVFSITVEQEDSESTELKFTVRVLTTEI